jgi:hypothetical protein
MYLLAQIPFASVELRWCSPLSGSVSSRSRQLRGAIAHAFTQDNRFHQYDAQGKPLYRYPQIQYRWQQGYGVIVGWYSGAETLLNVPWLDLALRLGEDEVMVTDAVISTQLAQFGVSPYLSHYHLITPVLLFNQDNYKKYQKLDNHAQCYERDRLLIAQLLTALRGLGVTCEAQLYAAFTHTKTTTCHYKNQAMIGIEGNLVTNLLLPSGFAVGHAVSHGYGWITLLEVNHALS